MPKKSGKKEGFSKADEEMWKNQLEQDKIHALVIRASDAAITSTELQSQLNTEQRKTNEFVHYFQHELEKKDALAAELQADLTRTQEELESTRIELTDTYETKIAKMSADWKKTEDGLESQLRQAQDQLQRLEEFRLNKEKIEERIRGLEENAVAQEARHRTEDADRERRFMMDKQMTAAEAEEKMHALQGEMRSRLASEREVESAMIMAENKRIKDEMRFMKELMKELKEDKRRASESGTKLARELAIHEESEAEYAKQSAKRARELAALRDRVAELEARAAAAATPSASSAPPHAAASRGAAAAAAAGKGPLHKSAAAEEEALAGGGGGEQGGESTMRSEEGQRGGNSPSTLARLQSELNEKDELIGQLMTALASCKDIVAEARRARATGAATLSEQKRRGGSPPPRDPLNPAAKKSTGRRGGAGESGASGSGGGAGDFFATSGARSLQPLAESSRGDLGVARSGGGDGGGVDPAAGASSPSPPHQFPHAPASHGEWPNSGGEAIQRPALVLPRSFPSLPKHPTKLPHFLPPQQGRRHTQHGGQHPELFRFHAMAEPNNGQAGSQIARRASDVGGKKGR